MTRVVTFPAFAALQLLPDSAGNSAPFCRNLDVAKPIADAACSRLATSEASNAAAQAFVFDEIDCSVTR